MIVYIKLCRLCVASVLLMPFASLSFQNYSSNVALILIIARYCLEGLHLQMSNILPKPSGKYSVGFSEILPKTGAEAVMFRLYYPTEEISNPEESFTTWNEDPEYIEGFCKFLKLGWMKSISNWLTKDVKLQIRSHGPLICEEKSSPSFPVIVFSHGLGVDGKSNAVLCGEIASHGFIVAAIEHKDLSASATYFLEPETSKKKWMYCHNPRSDSDSLKCTLFKMKMMKRSYECTECLNNLTDLNQGKLQNVLSQCDLSPFKGRLNLDQAVIVGHSMGGATVFMALKSEPRFKAGIAIDPWMITLEKSYNLSIYNHEYNQPVMIVSTEGFQSKMSQANIDSLKADKTCLTLNGVVHQVFGDFSFILPQIMGKWFGILSLIDAKVVIQVAADAISRFISSTVDFDYRHDLKSLVEKHDFLTFSETAA